MKRSTAYLILPLLTLAAILLWVDSYSTEASPAVAQAPQVQVARPFVSAVPVRRQYPGMVEAIDRAALHAQVSGYLETVAYTEGALVRKGDVLFRIDSRIYRARLAEAEAALAVARSDAELAKDESARADRLVKRNAIPAEEAQRRRAAAQMAAARELAAAAALDAARLQLDFTSIRAPFDGRIGRAKVTVGNLVTPADELAVLVALDELHVRIDIEETLLGEIGQGTNRQWTVNFELPGQDASWTGPVEIVGNEVRHGSVRLHARIANHQHKLVPGMYGQAELVTGVRPDALLIDERAIGTNQGQRYVLIVNEADQVEFRPVTVGGMHGQLREIIDGVSSEDRIVSNGLMRVRPGALVSPVEIPMTTLAAAALPSRAVSSH